MQGICNIFIKNHICTASKFFVCLFPFQDSLPASRTGLIQHVSIFFLTNYNDLLWSGITNTCCCHFTFTYKSLVLSICIVAMCIIGLYTCSGNCKLHANIDLSFPSSRPHICDDIFACLIMQFLMNVPHCLWLDLLTMEYINPEKDTRPTYAQS